MLTPLPTLQEMARLLGGEIRNGSIACPGPGHSAADRSLSVKPDQNAPSGMLVHSFAGDDAVACLDHVRSKLGLPKWEPKTKKKNGKGGKGNGNGAKAYSPTIAKFIYRTADGAPYLCVHRTANKKFPQFHWDGELWKSGKPKGEKIPYRLPELIATPITTPVYIVEGEGKADLLAKLGFTVTCASEGAEKWTADLNEWFKDRLVYILPDNDGLGRKHAQLVARNLDPVAKAVRVVELPGLPHHGDIKQWLEHDPSAARLVKECERAPLWEPAAEKPRTTEADEALIAELAALSTLAYAKRRTSAAEEIGIPVGQLDKAVAEARGEAKPADDEDWSVEPWPEEVATADLLDELCAVYKQHVILPEHTLETMALWVLHAWALDAFDISPFLFFRSPLARCGKTNCLRLINRTGPRTALASNISSAAIFRYVNAHHPTLIVDEADSFFTNNEEVRGILNSGHTRDAAFVIRCVGDNSEPHKFSTWAAKAVAAIGDLATTLQDRSIIVDLKRKRQDEVVAKLRSTDTEGFQTLRRKAARWRADNVERLREGRPDLPKALNDRAQDNWEPLLSIADLAGGDWPKMARAAAIALSLDAEADAETIGVQMLRDVRTIFVAQGVEAIFTKRLLPLLHAVEGAPWGSYGKSGKPITDRQLGRLMRSFRIRSRTVRAGDETAMGYWRSAFADAFQRYVSAQGGSLDNTPTQVSNINDLQQNLSNTGELDVLDKKSSNQRKTNECVGVLAKTTPQGQKEGEVVAERFCDDCHEPAPDGQLTSYAGEELWLHPDCINHFIEAEEEAREQTRVEPPVDDDLDIPDVLRVENRGLWGNR
jgi:hypothetical protein